MLHYVWFYKSQVFRNWKNSLYQLQLHWNLSLRIKFITLAKIDNTRALLFLTYYISSTFRNYSLSMTTVLACVLQAFPKKVNTFFILYTYLSYIPIYEIFKHLQLLWDRLTVFSVGLGLLLYHHLSIYLFIQATSIEHVLGARNCNRKGDTGRLWHFSFAGRCRTISALPLEKQQTNPHLLT